MTCKSYRARPVSYAWFYSLNDDRCTKYSSIKDRSYRTVRALPHFLKIILFHSCGVRRYGSAFYSNTIFLRSFCTVTCHFVICIISVLKSKIIIFCLEIYIRRDKFVLDHLPYDTCHLVSVHLNEWCLHLDLLQNIYLRFLISVFCISCNISVLYLCFISLFYISVLYLCLISKSSITVCRKILLRRNRTVLYVKISLSVFTI